MIDLKENSGLPIKLSQDYHLIFENNLPEVAPAVRTIDDMKEVLLDKTLKKPEELYYMYRDVAFSEDKEAQKKNQLRYDISVFKPDKLGKELMKSVGHYHSGDFPELYEVIAGEAWCLLQKPSKKNFKIIEDVILVKAKTKDKIICLPGYGHILIIPQNKTLVTSNWVSAQFKSDYSLYQKAQGAAYFILEENGSIKFQKNKFFTTVPSIREVIPSAKIEKFGLEKNKPIYPLIKSPEKLRFLNYPKEFDYSYVFTSEPK